jgi:hypothetical protein
MSLPLHLAVALDGAGWHPAAWRPADARPDELLSAQYWLDLVSEAECGLIDLVTIEDSLSLQSTRYGAADGRTDQVRGRLDAVLVAARVAPLTRHIGLDLVGQVGSLGVGVPQDERGRGEDLQFFWRPAVPWCRASW